LVLWRGRGGRSIFVLGAMQTEIIPLTLASLGVSDWFAAPSRCHLQRPV
jgi:hypothetical protein